MHRFRWQRISLAAKLNILMTLIVVLTAASITVLSIQREQQNFEIELQQQAQLTLEILEATVEDDLFFLNVDDISDILEKLEESAENLTFGRVYDSAGRVIADSFDEDLTFQVEADPRGAALLNEPEIIFEWQEEQVIAGKSISIGSLTLGAIAIGLPTTELQAKLTATQNRGITVAGVAILISITIAFLLGRSISHPIQQLALETERIANGELATKINMPHRKDEIGLLSGAMEEMRTQLHASYQNLEGQVKERTSELRVARDEALKASQFKTELLAKVSHELRTPLGAILGYAQLLQMGSYGDINGEQGETLDKVIVSSRYLTGIVSELLDQARMGTDTIQLHTAPTDLAALVEEVESQQRVLAETKALAFHVNIDPELPEIIHTDSRRVQQIMINLLGNAIKFTGKGSITFNIIKTNQSSWSFHITDTGPGISEEARERIFEPFGQEDGSITRRYGGTGLGLSISRELVTLMDGHMSLESEVGVGSTFIVTLPLHPHTKQVEVRHVEASS